MKYFRIVPVIVQLSLKGRINAFPVNEFPEEKGRKKIQMKFFISPEEKLQSHWNSFNCGLCKLFLVSDHYPVWSQRKNSRWLVFWFKFFSTQSKLQDKKKKLKVFISRGVQSQQAASDDDMDNLSFMVQGFNQLANKRYTSTFFSWHTILLLHGNQVCSRKTEYQFLGSSSRVQVYIDREQRKEVFLFSVAYAI